MGERCFIKVHNQAEPIGGSSNAKYSIGMAFEVDYQGIPLLWVAMFTKDDLKSLTVPEHFLGGDAPMVAGLGLHSSKGKALETYDRRLPTIRNHVNPAIWPYVELFRKAVADCPFGYVELDLHALWWIHGKSVARLREIILNQMQAFELDAAWSSLYGEKSIGDTSDLYGLPFFGSPFDGEIDLPWCHATPEGDVEPSKPRDDVMSLGGRQVHIDRDGEPKSELNIDDYFVLTHDTDGNLAARFADIFRKVWGGISDEVRDYLIGHWKDIAVVTLPGKPKQMVYTHGRPYLGLLKRIPMENLLSFDCVGGRALLWSALVVPLMDDAVLASFIGENIACAFGHAQDMVEMKSENYSEFVSKASGVDLACLTRWLHEHRSEIGIGVDQMREGAKPLADQEGDEFDSEMADEVDPVSVDYIDAATAKLFLEDPESVDIRWATGISDEAAAILADYGGDLLLDGLESLSPTAASALANHQGYMLGLASLVSLTEETGAALGKYKGRMIAFRRLEELSPEVAKGLSAFAGDILEMDSLDSISDETAEALGASRSDCLSLDGLMYLSAGVARGLANFQGSYLYLNRIQSLCPEAMEALGKYNGCLGLQSLSDE